MAHLHSYALHDLHNTYHQGQDAVKSSVYCLGTKVLLDFKSLGGGNMFGWKRVTCSEVSIGICVYDTCIHFFLLLRLLCPGLLIDTVM